MKKRTLSYYFIFSVLLSATIFYSCSSDSDDYVAVETSPVVLEIDQEPFEKLSDYNFFSGELKNLQPVYGVLPYKPMSELFTDYAKKSRFVWLPSGTKATYTSDSEVLDLPVGAALIKTFYYDNVQPNNARKIIETRLMIKKTDGWIFANYVWSEDQTEAVLQMTGSTVAVSWLDGNNVLQSVDYKIPSEIDCMKCHTGNTVTQPIGIKPQNLNSNYAYASGVKNQLTKWIEFGYLQNSLPANIVSTVDYLDATKSLALRARSYFDSNCAHCHRDGGNAEYVENLRMAFKLTSDPAKMGVCVAPSLLIPGIDHGRIVSPGSTSQSTLFYMMNTNDTGFRMPRVGRTVVHQEGITLMEQWINSLPVCN